MTLSYTEHMRLPIPDFNTVPWHAQWIDTMRAIDRVVYGALLTQDIALWANSTSYVAGDTVIDINDISTWICQEDHTSPAAPTTFATNRSDFPSRWVLATTVPRNQGDWTTGAHYHVGDVVIHDTTYVVCLVSHVAGVFATDLAAGKWEVLFILPAAPGDTFIIETNPGVNVQIRMGNSTSALQSYSMGRNDTTGTWRIAGNEVGNTGYAFADSTGDRVTFNMRSGQPIASFEYGTVGAPLPPTSLTDGYIGNVTSVVTNGVMTGSGRGSAIAAVYGQSIRNVGTDGIATGGLFRGIVNGTWTHTGPENDGGAIGVQAFADTIRGGVIFGANFIANATVQAGATVRGCELDIGCSAIPDSKVGLTIVSNSGDTAQVISTGSVGGVAITQSFAFQITATGGGVGFTTGIFTGIADGSSGNSITDNLWFDGNHSCQKGLAWTKSNFTQYAIGLPNASNIVGSNAAGSGIVSMIKVNASNQVSILDDKCVVTSGGVVAPSVSISPVTSYLIGGVGGNTLIDVAAGYTQIYGAGLPGGVRQIVLGPNGDPTLSFFNDTIGFLNAAGTVGFGNFTSAGLRLGVVNTTLGRLLMSGSTSGTVTIQPQAAAGSVTHTLPNATGTYAVNASAPIVLNATTGNLTLSLGATLTVSGSLQTLALSGDISSSANSFVTTLGSNVVTYAKFQQVAASSLVGNATGSLANATGITLGAALTFSGSALQTVAQTGDVTTSANSFATTIAANVVTYAKFQQVAAVSLVGNATGSLANATGITLGATLAFSGSVLQTVAHTGDVSTSANSFVTTIGATKVTSAMLNSDVFSTAHSWGGIQTLTTPVFTGLPTGTGVATANTVSTLVARDASGNFSAGAITATTINAFTLGGTIAGGGNQINNIIIGNTTPLASNFTTIGATGAFTSTSTTNATTIATGAVILAGGMGMAKDLYVGGAFVLTSRMFMSAIGTTTVAGNTNISMVRTNTQAVGISWTGVVSATPMIYSPINSDSIAFGFDTGAGPVNTVSIATTGVVTISQLATGNLTSAAGVVTSSSDERLKEMVGPFSRSLRDLIKMDDPILYRWNERSKIPSHDIFAGWTAQGVQKGIPEAVSMGPDGMLGLSDRPILAASVNAIKELHQRVQKLELQ